MKKIKLKKDIDPAMRPIERWDSVPGLSKPNEDMVVIDNEKELGNIKTNHLKLDDEHRWDGPLKFALDPNFLKCQKLAIESYYVGFLQYYDTIVRSGMIEHAVYFQWKDWKDEEKDKKICSQLTIFIWPAPIRKKISPFQHKKSNGGLAALPEKAQLSPLAPPPDGGSDATSDPPTGPQPPPPSG